LDDCQTPPQVSVSYVSSVTSPLLNVELMGCLNDVVVTGPDELYVTQYIGLPDGVEGRQVSTWEDNDDCGSDWGGSGDDWLVTTLSLVP